jgi:hypothetical protein
MKCKPNSCCAKRGDTRSKASGMTLMLFNMVV